MMTDFQKFINSTYVNKRREQARTKTHSKALADYLRAVGQMDINSADLSEAPTYDKTDHAKSAASAFAQVGAALNKVVQEKDYAERVQRADQERQQRNERDKKIDTDIAGLAKVYESDHERLGTQVNTNKENFERISAGMGKMDQRISDNANRIRNNTNALTDTRQQINNTNMTMQEINKLLQASTQQPNPANPHTPVQPTASPQK